MRQGLKSLRRWTRDLEVERYISQKFVSGFPKYVLCLNNLLKKVFGINSSQKQRCFRSKDHAATTVATNHKVWFNRFDRQSYRGSTKTSTVYTGVTRVADPRWTNGQSCPIYLKNCVIFDKFFHVYFLNWRNCVYMYIQYVGSVETLINSRMPVY